MKRIACLIFGHHNIRTKGFLPGFPDEIVCLRCHGRSSLQKENP